MTPARSRPLLAILKMAIFFAVALILVALWVLYFHNDWVAARAPKWGWLQESVQFLGQKKEPAEEADEDPDNTKNQIPVHAGQVALATLHRYVDGFGTVMPRGPRNGQMPGGATIAAPVAGVVTKVLCQAGQAVHAGDPLIQMDDRQARAAEQQAAAALAQEEAALALLKATPRADQLRIASNAVQKAEAAAAAAQLNEARQRQLAQDGSTSEKAAQQAQQDRQNAEWDLRTAQAQFDLLKSSPTPEELKQEEAKVAQARAALASAHVQVQMLTLAAPIDATVASLSVNPGESVDTTRTLVQLVALDRLMIHVDVPADQLPGKPEGLSAQITLSSQNPSDTANVTLGTITFVSPEVDPRNGSVTLGIDLPPDTALRPGRAVRVRIIAEEHKDVLAVPRAAVVQDENGDSVLAVLKDDQATHLVVKTGLEENGLIEVSGNGLEQGTRVVTEGAFGLRETQATHVKVVEQP